MSWVTCSCWWSVVYFLRKKKHYCAQLKIWMLARIIAVMYQHFHVLNKRQLLCLTRMSCEYGIPVHSRWTNFWLAKAKHTCLKWEMAQLNVKQPQTPRVLESCSCNACITSTVKQRQATAHLFLVFVSYFQLLPRFFTAFSTNQAFCPTRIQSSVLWRRPTFSSGSSSEYSEKATTENIKTPRCPAT